MRTVFASFVAPVELCNGAWVYVAALSEQNIKEKRQK